MKITASNSFNDSGDVIDSEVVIRMDVKEAKKIYGDLCDLDNARADFITKKMRSNLRVALGIE